MIFLFTRSRKEFARAMYSVPLFGIVREKKMLYCHWSETTAERELSRNLFVKGNKWGQYPVRRFEIQVSYE